MELLELRKEQLEARSQKDPEVERALEELRAKVLAYEAPKREPEAPKGMVQLGKKSADGSLIRIKSKPAVVEAPADAE